MIPHGTTLTTADMVSTCQGLCLYLSVSLLFPLLSLSLSARPFSYPLLFSLFLPLSSLPYSSPSFCMYTIWILSLFLQISLCECVHTQRSEDDLERQSSVSTLSETESVLLPAVFCRPAGPQAFRASPISP